MYQTPHSKSNINNNNNDKTKTEKKTVDGNIF